MMVFITILLLGLIYTLKKKAHWTGIQSHKQPLQLKNNQ